MPGPAKIENKGCFHKHKENLQNAENKNWGKCMTNFLSAAMINETLEDICQKISALIESLTEEDSMDLRRELQELETTTWCLYTFMEQFTCQPLIYTGPGSTEEIIKRLEWALAFSEEIDPRELFMLQKDTKKKTTPK